jgi:hypothetical protein
MKIIESWGFNRINYYLNHDQVLLAKISFHQLSTVAKIISFMIGFLVTFVIVSSEIYLFADLAIINYTLIQLLLMIAINLIFIALEFLLLFDIGFQITAQYVKYVGKAHFVDDKLKYSLVRAVLEMDEPVVKKFKWVSELRIKKKHYWLKLVLYKVKVILSNLLAKFIARKLLSRVGLRTYAPLVATIITGFWDAWVQGAVLKEVRLRLSGRMVAMATIDKLILDDRLIHEIIIRLLMIIMKMNEQPNVNLEFLLIHIEKKCATGILSYPNIFDVKVLTRLLKQLTVEQEEYFLCFAIDVLAMQSKKITPEELNFLSFLAIDERLLNRKKQDYDNLLV